MARILIVDDIALNRELLRCMLAPDGHELAEAESGQEALELADRFDPELVLLDVMMPGMNGFEVTKRLKEQPGVYRPIIMVSALNDSSSRVLALKLGADDFLTKPIDRSELMARTRNLLQMRRQELELKERNQELLELQQFREEMSQLVVHDLKNPLAMVISNLDYIARDRGVLPGDLGEALDDARTGTRRTIRLLANLLDVVRINARRLEVTRQPIALLQLMRPILEPQRRELSARGIELEVDVPEVEVTLDIDLIARVVENIVDNAVRHTPRGGTLAVRARLTDGTLEVRIGNSGAPIPTELRQKIFEKFGQADAGVRSNVGLGLYFCALTVQAHGGRLEASDEPGLPTVFVITLPMMAK